MTASSRRSLTLLVTLILAAPALLMLAEGALSVEQAALRCAGAVVLGWAGVAGFAALVRSYSPDSVPDLAGVPARPGDDGPG